MIDGEPVGLLWLIDETSQFVTAGVLEEKCVLFPHEETRSDIRHFIQSKGVDDGPLSYRCLQRALRTKVLGHPISSNDAERAVGGGQHAKQKYGHATREDHLAGTLTALLNDTRPDQKEAACEYAK